MPPSDLPALAAIWDGLTPEQAAAATMLVEAGQTHLFAAWPPVGESDDQKKAMLSQARPVPQRLWCLGPVLISLGLSDCRGRPEAMLMRIDDHLLVFHLMGRRRTSTRRSPGLGASERTSPARNSCWRTRRTTRTPLTASLRLSPRREQSA